MALFIILLTMSLEDTVCVSLHCDGGLREAPNQVITDAVVHKATAAIRVAKECAMEVRQLQGRVASFDQSVISVDLARIQMEATLHHKLCEARDRLRRELLGLWEVTGDGKVFDGLTFESVEDNQEVIIDYYSKWTKAWSKETEARQRLNQVESNIAMLQSEFGYLAFLRLKSLLVFEDEELLDAWLMSPHTPSPTLARRRRIISDVLTRLHEILKPNLKWDSQVRKVVQDSGQPFRIREAVRNIEREIIQNDRTIDAVSPNGRGKTPEP